MTDQQLYLAIGVPVVFNAAIVALAFTLLSGRVGDLNHRFGDLRNELTLTRQMFTEQLRRVEEIMDARLKHLEER